MKKVEISPGNIRLCLFATAIIPAGMELKYDYGDKQLWWRSQVYTFSEDRIICHLERKKRNVEINECKE